jgi:hypothetical protein
MKKLFSIILISCIFNASGENLFRFVPESSDYALKMNTSKALRIKGVADFLKEFPGYSLIKDDFSKKGVDFEKSFVEIGFAGKYGNKNSVFFVETILDEKKFLSLIDDKSLESFVMSGKKMYKFSERGKTIFAGYINKRVLAFSENPSLIADTKFMDVVKITDSVLGDEKQENDFLRGYFRGLAELAGKSGKKKNHINLLNPNLIKELFVTAKSADGKNVDVRGIACTAKPEDAKLVQFQINVLFRILAAYVSQTNQAAASQMTDSFKISNENEFVKAFFSIDSLSLASRLQDRKTDTGERTVFDPFEKEIDEGDGTK